MTALDIQKEIANAVASKTIDAILKDLGDLPFAILVDKSYDISVKEQLAIVLRYIDKHGHVIECFLGITLVSSTTAAELKKTINSVLSKHNLNISRLRGQGYDGVSNMQVISLITMFSSVIDMVEDIIEDGLNSEQKAKTNILIQSLKTLDFAFNLHLMKNVLEITKELSQSLQRKDQDILNAMKLVEISKLCLHAMREDGWNSLFEEVSKFCAENNIDVPNMDELY
ncbi:uncharacterized protein LOC132162896 [Corylus avellana]|uniref:uncharacterized protein LOC132162896 n=1 Tax=Corylus avellana TaxID=13451 RepID=UPI00286D5F3B|nr:uncharacterized protein LOC132162896 [Corylus avellana]